MLENKVKIVVARNPVDTNDRYLLEFEYVPGRKLRGYIPEIASISDVKLLASIDGKSTTDDWRDSVPEPGAVISIVPEYEASAVAAFVTGYATLSAALAAGAAAALAYSAVYLATTFVIGFGINTLASMISPDQEANSNVGSGINESPTYSWGEMIPTETEGTPIPIIFGKHKISGQKINQFTEVMDDGKEYLSMLLGIHDGKLDSITDIRIDDQPVGNYRGVKSFTRLGTLDDEPIEGFGQIVQQRSIQYKMTHDAPNILQTDGNSVDKIGLVFSAPNGLYEVNKQGGSDPVSVKMKIEYRTVGSDTWNHFKDFKISGSDSTAIRKQVNIPDLNPDRHEVRVTRLSGDSGSLRVQDTVYWSSFKEFVTENLIYPGLAKYAIKALATDQLSGSTNLSVTCIAERSTVSVYNPYSELWEVQSASNPAWAAYAFLNTHHGVHHSRLIYDEFYEWAEYCDEEVDGIPRFTCNIVIDSKSNVWSHVQRIANLGRAAIIPRGTKLGVFIDKPNDNVTDMFTMGNILEESFSMNYLPQKDRANAVEMTYTDPDRDYTRQVVSVFNEQYVQNDSTSKKSNIQIAAAIPRKQVIRDAAYMLNSNKHLIRTIEFEAATDAFACIVGDIIYFQHLIPHHEIAKGGRIVSADNGDGFSSAYVQIDNEVTLKPGESYSILVRLSDNTLVEKTVQSVEQETTTDTLYLNNNWSEVPDQYDVYDFGTASKYKKRYRVTSITRASQDNYRTLSCVEYKPEIYDHAEYYTHDPEWSESVIQEAKNVKVREFLVFGKGGDYQSNLAVSWNPMNDNIGSNWSVWLEDLTMRRIFSDDSATSFADTEDTIFEDSGESPGLWKIGDTSETSITIGADHLVLGHNYRVYIAPAGKGIKQDSDNTADVVIRGKLSAPDDVEGFVATWDVIHRSVLFSWQPVPNIDLDYYEIREGDYWGEGVVVKRVSKATSTSVGVDEGYAGDRTYWIKAVDTSGIESDVPNSDTVMVDTSQTPLQRPQTLNLDTRSAISTDGVDYSLLIASWSNEPALNSNFHHFEVKVTEITDGELEETSTYTTREFTYTWKVQPNVEYGVAVAGVDVSGNKTSFTPTEFLVAAKDSNPPSSPVNLSTIGFTGFIRLSFSHGGERDLSHFDIYRNVIDDFSTANKVGNVSRDFIGTNATFPDDPGDYNTHYYWVVAVDNSDNSSDPSLSATGSKTQINTVNISENAITAPLIKAGEIIADHIAAGAVTADKIEATEVSSVFATFGEMTAGILKSSNWGESGGSYIDLDSGLLRLGGSLSPQLDFDGSNLTIDATLTVRSGSTGIGSFSDAGALSTKDVVDYLNEVTGDEKPENNATVGGKLGVNIQDSLSQLLGDSDVITSQGTANDTSNVNGESASTVQSNATEGKLAKDKIDADVGSGTLEDTTGAQSKADAAESSAKSYTDEKIYSYGTDAYDASDLPSAYTTKHQFMTLDVTTSAGWPQEGAVVTQWVNDDRGVQVLYHGDGSGKEQVRYTTAALGDAWSSWTVKEIFSSSDVNALDTLNAPAQAGADVTGSNTADDVKTGDGKAVAEWGATNGGKLGVNIQDSLDNVLNDAEVITSQGTANDVLSGGGRAVSEHGATNDAAWRSAEDTSKIDGGNIYAGSRIQVGNLDGASDYCEITDGDIDFYYYSGGYHRHYKSLKRIEGGKSSDGDRVYIPGYWKRTPNIWTFPFSIETYNPDYSNQPQTTDCYPENITQYSTGRYYFDMVAASFMKSPVLPTDVNESFYDEYPDSGDNLTTDNFITSTHTTIDNVVEIIFNYEWECMCSDTQGTYTERIYADIYVTIDGSETLVESFSHEDTGHSQVVKGGANTKKISVPSGSHSISMRAYLRTHNDNSSYDPASYNAFTWHSYETSSSGNIRLKPGSARWIAIGE